MPARPRIELCTLLDRLSSHADRVIVTQESKQFVRRSFPVLAQDTRAAAETLRSWGVQPGMRVGIISENSYRWLVYDLALIALRCVSVPFPEMDVSSSDDGIFETHELNLLLVSSKFSPADIADRPRVARMDAENLHRVQASPAQPQRYKARDDDHSYVMGSGTSGSRKGMIASRRGV
jgi:acyl-CoA synthetase (AMP-forming)/AMP-acid ligase II